MKNEKTFQTKGPENKEGFNIKAEIKKILLTSAKESLSKAINKKDSNQKTYNPHESNPVRSDKFRETIDFNDKILTEHIENLQNFIQGVEELINVIDVSWVDKDDLSVLEKAKSSFGLDIAKLTAFLNDFRELKRTE